MENKICQNSSIKLFTIFGLHKIWTVEDTKDKAQQPMKAY